MMWLKLALGEKLILEIRRNLLPEEPATLLQWSPGPRNTLKECGTHDLALESANIPYQVYQQRMHTVDN